MTRGKVMPTSKGPVLFYRRELHYLVESTDTHQLLTVSFFLMYVARSANKEDQRLPLYVAKGDL